jgi:hypothetical protein
LGGVGVDAQAVFEISTRPRGGYFRNPDRLELLSKN